MEVSEKLILWYEENKRDLPWRRTKDPYHIWLSEIILQQTRIPQGLPYYLSFTQRFPTVKDLALAQEDEVLKLWQGLGYYSRARNMHKAAHVIHEKYQDSFPRTYQEIRDLPGVGDYTAAAIASFAYNLCHPVVDGNVIRFASRYNGIFEIAGSPASVSAIRPWLDTVIPPENPGAFNQAIMEFGALACTPQGALCQKADGTCPFSDNCYAHRHGVTDSLPVKKPKNPLPVWHLHYLLIRDKNCIWLKKRPYDDLWRGMYELPLWQFILEEDSSTGSTPQKLQQDKIQTWKESSLEYMAGQNPTLKFSNTDLLIPVKDPLEKISKEPRIYRQTLSHRKLVFHFYETEIHSRLKEILERQKTCFPVSIKDVPGYAVPKTIGKYLEDIKII